MTMKKMTREEEQALIAEIQAAVATKIVAANAAYLETLFDGTHAVLVLDREARKLLPPVAQMFPNAEDIEAVVIKREYAIVIASKIDAKVGVNLAVIPPEERTILPMLSILFGVTSTNEVRLNDHAPAPAPEHTPNPEAPVASHDG